MNNLRITVIILLSFFSLQACDTKKTSLTVSVTQDRQEIQFALDELARVLKTKELDLEITDKADADIQFVVDSNNIDIKPEGFLIALQDHKNNKKEKENRKILLAAVDTAGAMYAGLDLAEQIETRGLDSIVPGLHNPYMKRRGTKFNIPLDVRTPSYSDLSDSAQQNIEVVWDINFWKSYIDSIAKYRYNFISLWSLHPFPSLVKVPDYPDIALDDVRKSTAKFAENYSLNGIGFDAPDIINNTDIVKKFSIDEKIAFWREVMRYGKSRNVTFSIVTWNIFVNGTDGKYGITDKFDNPITRDYFRKSVAQLFRTYPDLDGIGVTLGENMHGISPEQGEEWAYETYAAGLLEVAKEMPNRHFTFIHRQHLSSTVEIAKTFQPLLDQQNIDFIYSFKYAKAHVFSATEQPYHHEFIKDIGDQKTLWTLRNDDNYYFRWGAPDFVREFIKNMPYDVSAGIYYGSDQWVWARDFTSKVPQLPRQLEVEKHWYHWLIWGRLAYDPSTSNEQFVNLLRVKFPEVDAQTLFDAWQNASMIYPITTGFHWGPLDLHWYIEGCRSRPGYAQNLTGFHDVNRFINLPPHPNAGFESIPDFIARTLGIANHQTQISAKVENTPVVVIENSTAEELSSPFEVADLLDAYADQVQANLSSMNAKTNKELAATLQDIKTMALLGKYYAAKIRGATHLHWFRQTQDAEQQKLAVEALAKALVYWKDYVAAATVNNINPIWTNRVGYVDWEKTTISVAEDLEIARQGLPAPKVEVPVKKQ